MKKSKKTPEPPAVIVTNTPPMTTVRLTIDRSDLTPVMMRKFLERIPDDAAIDAYSSYGSTMLSSTFPTK